MTKRTACALLVAGSLTTSSVALPSASRAQGPREAAEVRAARAAQNTALARHDLDRAATFWTDDIVIRSGLGRVIESKTAYKNAFAGEPDLDGLTLLHSEEGTGMSPYQGEVPVLARVIARR